MKTDNHATRPRRQRNLSADVGCATLFGLPFAGFGLAIGWVAVGEFQKHGITHAEAWFALLMHVIFVGVGIGLPFMARRGAKIEAARRKELEDHADKVWLTRPDWRSGRIDHNAYSDAKGIMWIALFWNLISIPAAYGAITQEYLAKGKNEALLVLIFPLAGAYFIGATIYQFVKAARFGKSRFVMAEIPASIGTVLRGIVVTRVPRIAAADSPFQVRLTCFRKHVVGTGKHRRTKFVNQWMDERQFMPTARRDDPQHLALPVAFPIPSDSQQTTLDNPEDCILWRLSVKAKISGVDYDAEFELPVFRTPDSPPEGDPVKDAGTHDAAFATAESAIEESTGPTSRGIRSSPLAGGGIEVRFAPMRNLGPVCGLAIFNVLWAGAIYFGYVKGAPIIFPILFGLFQIPLLLGLLHLMTAAAVISARFGTIRFKRGPFALGATKSVNAQDLAGITISAGMQSGDTYYWDLKLKSRNSSQRCLVRGIKDRNEAEWIATSIAVAAGLPADAVTIAHRRSKKPNS